MSLQRKMQRAAAKRDGSRKPHRGPCMVKRCKNNGGMGLACEICNHEVRFCEAHCEKGSNAIKKHVLLKHPATLPLWMLRRLKGEE